MIVFAAYVGEEEAGATGVTFSSWLQVRLPIEPVQCEELTRQSRPEIWKYVTPAMFIPSSLTVNVQVADQDSQIKIIRRQGGNRLFAFAPVNDLSLISKSSDALDGRDGSYAERRKDGDVHGAQILGDEWAEHVVTNRAGIMLRAS